MKLNIKTTLFAITSVLIISSCTNKPKDDQDKESVVVEPGRAEHARDVEKASMVANMMENTNKNWFF